MKKIFLSLILLSFIGCGKTTYEDVEKKVNSLSTTKNKVEYIKNLKGKTSEEDLKKIQALYDKLVLMQEEEENIIRIKSTLPKRDGFNNGVAFSVINFIKENFNNSDDIEFIKGGNTLKLTNGLFFQDVRIKYNNTVETMYFLIQDNSYDSSSIVGVLKNSDEFYNDYLKKNGIEIATDEVYNYYFNK